MVVQFQVLVVGVDHYAGDLERHGPTVMCPRGMQGSVVNDNVAHRVNEPGAVLEGLRVLRCVCAR